MCCYRDVKNFERFYLVVQSILCLSVCQLKLLNDELIDSVEVSSSNEQFDKEKPSTSSVTIENTNENNDDKSDTPETDEKDLKSAEYSGIIEDPEKEQSNNDRESTEEWSMQQREKLMHIVSKIFLLNFPLYLASKHSTLSRLDDLSAQEISNLSSYCDLHDTEIPSYLLRNVSLFCKLGGVSTMASVFEYANPSTLPLSMAHALVAAVGNLKLWLNFRAVTQLFMPLRCKILKYMCSLEDKDLRVPAVKSMAGKYKLCICII